MAEEVYFKSQHAQIRNPTTPPKAPNPPHKHVTQLQPTLPGLLRALPNKHVSPCHCHDRRTLSLTGRLYTSAVDKIRSFVTSPSSTPSFWETASVTDKCGLFNIVVIAFWPSVPSFEAWKTESRFEGWWKSTERELDGHGWFQEVVLPPVDRFETVFSNNGIPEGAENMRENIGGELGEHAYWGSMRGRLAAAQDDQLEGEKRVAASNEAAIEAQEDPGAKRVAVSGQKNLCVIRSGQD
ncbi:hypothetical protein E8E12_007424 [Didymella heteroderae]|uniref:Uncharacterized protein n=1 Tax=Didymella heteroderae TaxID=1769908 RepID=A0A9P4WP28_9PLEO|nr:hypothetical protein E8E12_007424 [Didymella heteroderae]